MPNYSYEYQNLIRDLANPFQLLVASQPTLLSLIKVGTDCRAQKVEWGNEQLSPVASAVASFDTDGDGTGINVASTSGLQAGSIVRFTSAAGNTYTEQARVVSVDSATELTLSRYYAGTTGITLLVGDVMHLVSSPIGEKTVAGTSPSGEGIVDFNYTEIFDAIADLSRTAINVGIYGNESIGDLMNREVERKMASVMYRMNNALIHGNKVARSGANEGTMGGILSYINQAGGNIETTGGALSAVIINNMLEKIYEDGGYSNNYAIVANVNQARRISAFNSGSNPIIQMQPSVNGAYPTFGGAITSFAGDLPVQSGFRAQVVVDSNFPRDQIAMVDLNKIELTALQNSALKDMDATNPGYDGLKRRLLGEYSLRVYNAKEAHAIAVGLSL